MKKHFLLGAGLLVLAVLSGCNNQQGGKPKDADNSSGKERDKAARKAGEDEHDHGPGPHHGTVFDFGKWHAEFTVNHKAQEATVYIQGVESKKPEPIAVEKLLLSIKSPQFQVDLKAVPEKGDPAGKSSRFVGKNKNLGREQEYEGTLSGVVDGKPYAGDFKEEEEKDHKHEKK